MRTLEIIQLRSAATSLDRLHEQIKSSLGTVTGRAEVLTIFRRSGLATDLAIHIHHSDGAGTNEQSELGIRLAASLKGYGLVEHSVWEMLG